MNEMKPYVENIRPYLHDMLSDFKKSSEWKIYFTSSKDGNEKRKMNSKSDYREIRIANDTDEIIEKLLNSLLHRYLASLEPMTGSYFLID